MPPSDSMPGVKSLGVAAALVLLVAGIYAQSRTFESLDFDDQEYVYANGYVLQGVNGDSIAWAFTAFHAANWHPLTWISHMADVQLFGPGPGPHHLVNAGLHATNAVVLFFVLRVATSAFWPSAIVAALFAAHPLNVESVAWISQRKSVLSTLFLFLSLGAYVAWTRRRSVWRAALVGLCLALGLLCKPMLVSAPLLFLALDFWPLERLNGRSSLRSLILEKLPYFALAAAAAAATILAQSSAKAVASTAGFPLVDRVSNAAIATVLYLRDAMWPVGLACFYPHAATFGRHPSILGAFAATVVLGALTWIAFATRRNRPWLLFGWAWYLTALGPVVGLIQVGSQARADRYAYVPLIGIFAAVVWEVSSRTRTARAPAVVGTITGALIVAFLGVLASIQTAAWKNGETLYTHALKVTRDNWLALNNLGNFWLSRKQPDRALACFRKTVRIKPDYEDAWYNEGVALAALSRPAEAAAAYKESLRLDPSNTDGWVNLGFALLTMRRVPEGLQAYENALSQRPYDPRALHGAAIARAVLGDRATALRYLQRLRDIDPAQAAELESELGVHPN